MAISDAPGSIGFNFDAFGNTFDVAEAIGDDENAELDSIFAMLNRGMLPTLEGKRSLDFANEMARNLGVMSFDLGKLGGTSDSGLGAAMSAALGAQQTAQNLGGRNASEFNLEASIAEAMNAFEEANPPTAPTGAEPATTFSVVDKHGRTLDTLDPAHNLSFDPAQEFDDFSVPAPAVDLDDPQGNTQGLAAATAAQNAIGNFDPTTGRFAPSQAAIDAQKAKEDAAAKERENHALIGLVPQAMRSIIDFLERDKSRQMEMQHDGRFALGMFNDDQNRNFAGDFTGEVGGTMPGDFGPGGESPNPIVDLFRSLDELIPNNTVDNQQFVEPEVFDELIESINESGPGLDPTVATQFRRAAVNPTALKSEFQASQLEELLGLGNPFDTDAELRALLEPAFNEFVGSIDPNASLGQFESAFDLPNLQATTFDTERTRRRNLFGEDVATASAPFADFFKDTDDDTIIESILDERQKGPQKEISTAQARGNLNALGAFNANQALKEQRLAGSERLNTIGGSILNVNQRDIDDLFGVAERQATSFPLSSSVFDVSPFTTQAQSIADARTASLEEDIRTGLGTETLFDPSKALSTGASAGGLVGGNSALGGSAPLLDAISQRATGSRTKQRGLGTQGAF